MKRHKFMLTAWHAFAIATLALSVGFVGLILFWTIQGATQPVVEFPDGLVFEQTEVQAGGNLTLKSGYCKNTDTTSTTVTRSFTDEITYYVPAGVNNIPKGCKLDFKAKVNIPDNLPPDKYIYTITFTYEVNPIVTKQYTFRSNEITVTAKESK
jgi:hypothetical protein